MHLPRALVLASLLPSLPCAPASADAPPPPQDLDTDPEPPRPTIGLGADAGAMIFGDYTVRLDVLLLPALSVGVTAGASRRSASDDVLAELALTLWCWGQGLEGPFLTAVAGIAWAGPWTQEPGATPRLGAEAGWQFRWDSLLIGVGGGVHAAFRADGVVVPEVRLRGVLGVLF